MTKHSGSTSFRDCEAKGNTINMAVVAKRGSGHSAVGVLG